MEALVASALAAIENGRSPLLEGVLGFREMEALAAEKGV